MARPRGKRRTAAARSIKAAEKQIVNYAEDLGHFLGRVRANVSNWNSQRQRLVKELTDVSDTAEQLLAQLGRDTRRGARRAEKARVAGMKAVRRTARTVGAAAKTAGKRQRTMSKAVRRKMALARKKWWAARKAAAKKLGR